MSRVLVVATSRKTRGGITSVIKAHETGEQWKKFHCYWIQTHRDGPAWRKLFYFATALIQFLILVPFCDIVHIHGAARSSAKRKKTFIKIAKFFGKKVIYHFHPSDPGLLFNKEIAFTVKSVFDLVDLLIVLAPQWQRWIDEVFPDSHYNMKVLYNPCPVVNRKNIERKKQILYAGRVGERKGYKILLQAFAPIANKYPDWRILFAGDGELENGKRLAMNLGIDAQVKWLGWIVGEDKDKVFQESSIYCLPSSGEGFPMGVLDAWAYGIPSIMTPVGGIPDIVIDGEQGLIVPIHNVEALTEKLDKLMQSEILRTHLREKADELVFGLFSVQQVTKRLEDIYANLLKE